MWPFKKKQQPVEENNLAKIVAGIGAAAGAGLGLKVGGVGLAAMGSAIGVPVVVVVGTGALVLGGLGYLVGKPKKITETVPVSRGDWRAVGAVLGIVIGAGIGLIIGDLGVTAMGAEVVFPKSVVAVSAALVFGAIGYFVGKLIKNNE